jgi:23S rRNA (guanine745-N1)-methyltransferase
MNNAIVKKKDRIKALLRENQRLFKCPVCSQPMAVNNFYSMKCSNSHSFDLSKKGYINLLTSAYEPVYSKDLFEARHKVCEAGFYDPLIEELSKMIGEYRGAHNNKKVSVLDAGCGEGSHLQKISLKLKEDSNHNFIGIDISKDSINIAANNNSDIIWCVADLARLPFNNASFDVILNILSPANYTEFERVLRDKGTIIKVVPGLHYLKELRGTIFKDKGTADYSNEKVISYFANKLEVVYSKIIKYKFTMNEKLFVSLVKMTPLTWNVSEERLEDLLKKDISSITIDLRVIAGKPK